MYGCPDRYAGDGSLSRGVKYHKDAYRGGTGQIGLAELGHFAAD
ncbi:hypothetical protein SNL152K_3215 [Streptomyces sp. NL15-2K]|nr:hypothetical protein SNL152K_3215 [Streptomyces sp. NL15-2K]